MIGLRGSSSRSGSLIRVDLTPGRLRRLWHTLHLAIAGTAAWVWFGAGGLILILIWWWHRGRSVPLVACFSLEEVRFVRLGIFRIYLGLPGLRRLEIFRDELPAEEFSRLCRLLKANTLQLPVETPPGD